MGTGQHGTPQVNPPWQGSFEPIDAPEFYPAGSTTRIEWTNHIDLTTLMWFPVQNSVYRES
jgi:hypothetical protein